MIKDENYLSDAKIALLTALEELEIQYVDSLSLLPDQKSYSYGNVCEKWRIHSFFGKSKN